MGSKGEKRDSNGCIFRRNGLSCGYKNGTGGVIVPAPSQRDNQIINGVIWKQLLVFFFPIAVGSIFQQFYNTVDAIIVGRFVGKEALASVGGSAAMVCSLVLGFFTGL